MRPPAQIAHNLDVLGIAGEDREPVAARDRPQDQALGREAVGEHGAIRRGGSRAGGQIS